MVNDGCNTTNRGQGIVVQVEATGNVTLNRWNSLEDKPLLPDWVVEAPHDGSRFK